MKDEANIDDRDIIQVSATIIAGALIFLTVSAIVTPAVDKISRLTPLVISTGAIVVFTLSCISIVLGKRPYGLGFMLIGFIYLLVAAIIHMFFTNRVLLQEIFRMVGMFIFTVTKYKRAKICCEICSIFQFIYAGEINKVSICGINEIINCIYKKCQTLFGLRSIYYHRITPVIC